MKKSCPSTPESQQVSPHFWVGQGRQVKLGFALAAPVDVLQPAN